MKTVVLGTDFSVAADAALVQAANLAARMSAEVVVTHVCPPRSAIPPMLREAYEAASVTASDAIAAALDERCKTIRQHGARASSRLLTGDPPSELAELAGTLAADAIVVGSLGRTGLERLLLGSVAERTVRHATTPVLVARADTGARYGYRSVLVATDFSEAADAAFDLACRLATTDGRIELFHVLVGPQVVGAGLGAGSSPGSISPEATRKLKDWADESARHRIELHRSDRVLIEHSTSFGPIAATILDKLEERAFDLVVLGSHGRAGVRRLLLGSVAEKVLRHAPCSALVVPNAAAHQHH